MMTQHYFKTKVILTGLMLTCFCLAGFAQQLTELTGKRFYEHHSSSIGGPNGAPNGDQSGYDFVNHDYVCSFNPTNYGPYTNGEEQNIDMVEHNGPFSGPLSFGFTSGISSIWAGDIVGNKSTMWVAASSSFDYTTVNDVSDLKAEYDASSADSSIEEVSEGGIYIGRIRNGDMYVVMKCYNVNNASNPNQDTYFDFDYKYGTLGTTNVSETEIQKLISIFPNPTSSLLNLENMGLGNMEISILNAQGEIVETLLLQSGEHKALDLNNYASGYYILRGEYRKGAYFSKRISKI